MADEKLPDDLLPQWLLGMIGRYAEQVELHTTRAVLDLDRLAAWEQLIQAIHRFAREREAAALEKVAKLPDLRWPHIVSPCVCCEDLRQQWKALAEPGKGGAT